MNNKLKLTYRNMLELLEHNSTCSRVKVASIIVKDGRIISTGWNGVPSGFKHCEDIFKKDLIPCESSGFKTIYKIYDDEVTAEEWYKKHHEFSEKYELHAEQNSIAFAAKNNISTQGASIFITITPCSNCAKLILQSGIKKVYYKDIYDRSSEGFDLLKEAETKGRIELEKI